MTHPLAFASALHQIGELRASTLPDLAIECLIQGMYSESLLLLADESEFSDPSRLYGLFDACAIELGVAVPSHSDSILMASVQIASEVTAGHTSPREGILHVADLFNDARGLAARGVLRELGIEAIIAHYEQNEYAVHFEGDDLPQSRIGGLDHAVFKACQRLVTGGSQYAVDSASVFPWRFVASR